MHEKKLTLLQNTLIEQTKSFREGLYPSENDKYLENRRIRRTGKVRNRGMSTPGRGNREKVPSLLKPRDGDDGSGKWHGKAGNTWC